MIAFSDLGDFGAVAIRDNGSVYLKGSWASSGVWTNMTGSYLSPFTG